uniref:Uncharacterized protein n=1 Tax=Ascaris lumbricoides TaxID=6252 RepID=A0A0M3ILP0_ASCLU
MLNFFFFNPVNESSLKEVFLLARHMNFCSAQ